MPAAGGASSPWISYICPAGARPKPRPSYADSVQHCCAHNRARHCAPCLRRGAIGCGGISQCISCTITPHRRWQNAMILAITVFRILTIVFAGPRSLRRHPRLLGCLRLPDLAQVREEEQSQQPQTCFAWRPDLLSDGETTFSFKLLKSRQPIRTQSCTRLS